jgi:hypothetical protein
LSETGPQELAS